MRLISILFGLVLLYFGFQLALLFPDLDHKFRFGILVQHRSLLTHNALPCLIWIPFGRAFGVAGAMGAFGLATGIVLHLGADMFPHAWAGFAFIYIPVLGRLTWIPLDGNWIPTVFSFCWLGMNVLIAVGCFFSVLGEEGEAS